MVILDRLRSWWRQARSSLWYLPTIFAVFALALGFLVPELDAEGIEQVAEQRDWLFSGSPSAARVILSVIAGSLITVISLLFSITIIALQQASTQFTPRVFRHFTSDRGNQLVLAVYIATFTYALMILRQIRDEDAAGGAFVPILAVIVAVVFALVCLAALIYFIHHASTLLQASTVIERAHRELVEQLDHLYPEDVGQAASDSSRGADVARAPLTTNGQVVTAANNSGYLQAITHELIVDLLPDGGWAVIHARVGDYVVRETPLVEIGGLAGTLSGDQENRLRQAFLLMDERTLEQDAMFGIRQLVDIALKGLSPSINDPTTAEQAISCLADALTQLAKRDIPSQRRLVLHASDEDGGAKWVTLWFSEPDFNDYVDAAFNQIRTTAHGDVHVMVHLLAALGDVGRKARGENADVLRQQVEMILWQAGRLDLSPLDQRRISAQASESARLIGAGAIA